MTAVESSPQAGLNRGLARGSSASETDPLDSLMSRYADGEEAVFGELFKGLSPRLRGFLRRMSGSEALADDLVQETFLRIHQARGSFMRGASVLAWSIAIARNCFLSHARSAKTKLDKNSVDVSHPRTEISAGVAETAEQVSIAKQSAAAVERALAEMTVARREAFILVRYEGMSIAEAARILGVTEGAAKLRAFHANETIRAALRELETEKSDAPSAHG